MNGCVPLSFGGGDCLWLDGRVVRDMYAFRINKYQCFFSTLLYVKRNGFRFNTAAKVPGVSRNVHSNSNKNRLGKCMELELEHGTILQPLGHVGSAVTTHKTFGPTDLTSTYSVWQRIFDSIGHQTQAFQSGVQCSNH
ncbi:hypothetical protein TNCV_1218761 [Trichonephila clavipes]|nr:hypothetical protein TNCV_1218761 [Trichonephila clavipes]